MIDDLLGLPDEELASPRTSWDDDELDYLRRHWKSQSAAEISAALPQRTRNSVIGMARRPGLPAKRIPGAARPRRSTPNVKLRKAYASRGDDVTLSRFVKIGTPHLPTQQQLLDSPRALDPKLKRRKWVVAGRSKFHAKGIRAPDSQPNVLVSGHCNAKIGRDVRKGKLRGYWIYTLTLEERATCPRTCHHWATCYGNGMPYAKRIDHRDQAKLQAAIEADVRRLLSVKGRVGILVRLHALGDFFSPSYVEFWQTLLAFHSRLAVYGYTAWSPDSPVGAQIAKAKALYGDRFAIRWSNGGGETDCTVPVLAVDEPVNAIVCPEQTGRARACATCALCWSTDRNIAFVEH